MKNSLYAQIPNCKINNETTEDVLFTIISNISDLQSNQVMNLDNQLALSNLKEYVSSYRKQVVSQIKQGIKARKELGLPIN